VTGLLRIIDGFTKKSGTGGSSFTLVTSGHPFGFVQSFLLTDCFFSKSHGIQLPSEQGPIIGLHNAARAKIFNSDPTYNNKSKY
jgi:hypothetical protein